MSDTRKQAHYSIDRLPEAQLASLVRFLETIVDPAAAALERAPIDDEAESEGESEGEKTAVSEAREWLGRNGGKGIPHEEAMRRLGLD